MTTTTICINDLEVKKYKILKANSHQFELEDEPMRSESLKSQTYRDLRRLNQQMSAQVDGEEENTPDSHDKNLSLNKPKS